jgi:2-oxoglutarate dehydrogenase complex dehydrogenase (E1) component-like enzyme
MYDAWRIDPSSVHVSWRNYFSNIEGGVAEPYTEPPTLGQTKPA